MSSLSRMFMFSLAAGIMISLNSWENKYVSLSSLRAVQILSFPTLVKKFESSLTIWRKIWDTRYLSQKESSRDEYNFWALIVIGFFAWIFVWTTSAQFMKNSSYLKINKKRLGTSKKEISTRCWVWSKVLSWQSLKPVSFGGPMFTDKQLLSMRHSYLQSWVMNSSPIGK